MPGFIGGVLQSQGRNEAERRFAVKRGGVLQIGEREQYEERGRWKRKES